MVYHIAYNQRLEPKSDLLEWITPSNDLFKGLLDQWIQKALEIDPSDRYANAGEMLSALNILLTDSTPTFADDSQIVLAALSDYQQSLNPLSKWPQIGELNNDDERGRMSYTSLVDALPVRVHWWPSLQPQPGQNGNNRRLLQFLKRCQVFKENTLRAPMVVAFGISSMGLFVVQSKIDGYPLDEWLRLIQDREEALDLQFKLSESLIHALNQLHDIGVGHGDLKPDNLFVCGNIYEPVVMLIDCLDIGRSGQMPENHIYAPVLQTTAIERDRYAVYKIIREILPTGNDQTLPVHQEIDRALGIDSQQIPLALEPLRESLTNALLPVEQEPEPLRFWCLGLRDINSGDVLEQDQGRYYLSVKYNEDEKLLRVFIAGLTHQLNLHLALEQNELIIKHAFIKKIPPSELMRSAQAASNSRNNNAQIITHPIQLIESGSNTLLQDLLQQSVVRYALSLDSESSMVVSSELEGRMLPRLWTALLDAEDELNPVVTVNNPLSFDRGAKEWTIPITPRLIELEFDSGSEIQVVEDTERHWVYGDLDTEKSNLKSGFLIVKPSRSNKLFQNIKEDTRLQLVDRQASSSRDRRKKALDRVLNGESLIPDLVQRFDVDAPSVVETIKPIAEPAHDVFRRYSRLDESKAAAFHHVLTQRLSVLMGPPGTGKTTLLAYLLDHLNRQPEIKRVLLVSQSNVAVDEVATQARKVIRELALDEGRDPDQVVPSMVRLGDRAKVNTLLLDIHVDALQSQYRTRFHREFELRLLALSPRLGLQHEFILASAKLYREVGRELYEYVQATRIIIELDAILETKTAKYLIERRDIALIQKKRLSDKLNKQLLAYTDEPEVVLESNNPMNELLHDLGTKHRINNPQQIMKLGELIQLSHDWLSRLATDTTGFASFMAKTRQWIIGTLVGVGKPAYNIKDNQYDIAIIDEAGRASANELAMAMQSARRVVLVGDHLQLPPMYNSAVIKSVAMRLNISKKEVCKTDFERAFKASKGAMLTKQYRMAEPIGNLISHVFYEGKLDTGRPPAADWMAKLATPWEKVVTWIDTSSPQRNENIIDKGVFNKTEVDLICSLLRTLLDSSDGVLDKLRHWAKEDTIPPIGIITGYSKQVSAIQKMMETDSSMMGLRSLVRIDTIDSYQGSENRIVLLSLVRHNMDNQTGFMEDWPRINVALSRAKERLMIIGASQMWVSTNGDSPLGEVYRFIRKKHNEVDPFYRIYTLNELKS